MNPIALQTVINAFGERLTSSVSIDPDGAKYEKPIAGLPAGKPGSLTTRTDDDTGVATLSTGHGIVSEDTVDVYWAGGMRYGMVATVATNAVTIEGGAGDNLPLALTAVVVTKQVVIDLVFTGNKALAIIAHCTTRANIEFQQAAGTSIKQRNLTAGRAWIWDVDDGYTNPLANAAVGKIVASNGDAATTAELTIIIPYDSVA